MNTRALAFVLVCPYGLLLKPIFLYADFQTMKTLLQFHRYKPVSYTYKVLKKNFIAKEKKSPLEFKRVFFWAARLHPISIWVLLRKKGNRKKRNIRRRHQKKRIKNEECMCTYSPFYILARVAFSSMWMLNIWIISNLDFQTRELPRFYFWKKKSNNNNNDDNVNSDSGGDDVDNIKTKFNFTAIFFGVQEIWLYKAFQEILHIRRKFLFEV